jgi:CHAT domain-containing protein/Tfp pilus assembly protein PilF
MHYGGQAFDEPKRKLRLKALCLILAALFLLASPCTGRAEGAGTGSESTSRGLEVIGTRSESAWGGLEAVGTGSASAWGSVEVVDARLYVLGSRLAPDARISQREMWRELNERIAALHKSGRYEEARDLALQALKVANDTFGPDHLNTAISLNILAEIDRVTGRFAEAEPFYRRALAIREKALRPDHPDIAQVLNNLALLYYEMGRYAEAEPMNRRALTIVINALGIEHPYAATCMNNLAGLYVSLGRYPEAEKLYRWALEVREKTLGTGHPDVAQVLNNLAELYLLLGRYKEAGPLYERALSIIEGALGAEHPGLTPALNNLALLYAEMGRYDEAEALYLRSLRIIEKSFGSDHPRAAMGRNNLAELYRTAGKLSQADPLFRRALAALEKVLGPRHPDVALVLHNLAVLEALQGKKAESLSHFRKALASQDFMADTVFSLSSERQKFQYLATIRASYDVFLSLVLGELRDAKGAVREAMDVQIRRKGAVLDSLSHDRDALFASAGPEARARYEKYRKICSQIATLATGGSDESREALEALELKKEQLERDLADFSAAYRSRLSKRAADTRSVAAGLPRGTLLVDYACIRVTSSSPRERESRKFIAFILPSSQADSEPVLVDLGDAEVIEDAVREFREEAARVPKLLRSGLFDERSAGEEMSHISRRLYNLVILPLRRELEKDAVTLFLSPDGELNLIPFGVLEDEGGRYLIEDYAINYVSAARDVLRFGEKRGNSGERIVIANPDYDLPWSGSERRTEGYGVRGTFARHWSALPGTAKEAAIISQIFPGTVCRLGAEAREEYVKSLKPPEFLHLATHGFFLPDEWQERGSRALLAGNPLLSSGLVFAGANNLGKGELPEGTDDGILTALEISGISLRGTNLVVLSACETGVGKTRTGEGVFGLRRAFQLTGAETVVMSLWSVPDKETCELMGEFYERLKRGEGKSEALRNACLAAKGARQASKGASHPFFWGAFISAGEP